MEDEEAQVGRGRKKHEAQAFPRLSARVESCMQKKRPAFSHWFTSDFLIIAIVHRHSNVLRILSSPAAAL